MRRASVHLIFGALALGCAGYAAWQGVRLMHARSLEAAVAQVLAGDAPAPVAHDPGAPPQVRLAAAVMLSKAGDHATASSLYDTLIAASPDLSDPVARAALFDSAGMRLREGSVDGRASELRSLPQIDDAKTRYRTLLRARPDDWDARYNLERALRLVPELQDSPARASVDHTHDVRLRGAESQDLP